MRDIVGLSQLSCLRNELHVWIAELSAVSAQQLICNYFPLLSSDESDRFKRFYFEHDRLNYLAAHALLRIALSNYFPRTPEEWRFENGIYGKPEIAIKMGLPPLRFNLSHTHGMVACAIGYDCQCGIDVEEIKPVDDVRPLKDMILSDSELAYIETKNELCWTEDFFSFWTLKEACAKAVGLGLSAPLKKISFRVDAQHISVDFGANECDREQWIFQSIAPSNSHRLAVAVKSKSYVKSFVYHAFCFLSGTFSRINFPKNFVFQEMGYNKKERES